VREDYRWERRVDIQWEQLKTAMCCRVTKKTDEQSSDGLLEDIIRQKTTIGSLE